MLSNIECRSAGLSLSIYSIGILDEFGGYYSVNSEAFTNDIIKPKIKSQNMIKHVVMWKLKEVAEGKTKTENAWTMKKLLEDLPAKIDELKSAEVGINILEGEDEAISDMVLTVSCESEEDLKVYAEHPDHQKVVSFIKKVVSERRVVDYNQ